MPNTSKGCKGRQRPRLSARWRSGACPERRSKCSSPGAQGGRKKTHVTAMRNPRRNFQRRK
eukprot:566331-Alexandrium_andersonii.AAC.1